MAARDSHTYFVICIQKTQYVLTIFRKSGGSGYEVFPPVNFLTGNEKSELAISTGGFALRL